MERQYDFRVLDGTLQAFPGCCGARVLVGLNGHFQPLMRTTRSAKGQLKRLARRGFVMAIATQQQEHAHGQLKRLGFKPFGETFNGPGGNLLTLYVMCLNPPRNKRRGQGNAA